MSNRQKGDKAERTLSNWLEDTGDYHAQPTGSSGSGTDRDRPDVFAARDQTGGGKVARVLLVEVKAWSDATGTLSRAEVLALQRAAARAGGEAWVAVKPDLRSFDQWHCFRADELHETPEGNFSVRKQDHPGESRAEAFGRRESAVCTHTGP